MVKSNFILAITLFFLSACEQENFLSVTTLDAVTDIFYVDGIVDGRKINKNLSWYSNSTNYYDGREHKSNNAFFSVLYESPSPLSRNTMHYEPDYYNSLDGFAFYFRASDTSVLDPLFSSTINSREFGDSLHCEFTLYVDGQTYWTDSSAFDFKLEYAIDTVMQGRSLAFPFETYKIHTLTIPNITLTNMNNTTDHKQITSLTMRFPMI